jgi:hypothetical protein
MARDGAPCRSKLLGIEKREDEVGRDEEGDCAA